MDRGSPTVIARLPSHTEFWYGRTVPQAGARLVHHGEEYEVASCEHVGTYRFVVQLVKPAVSATIASTIQKVELTADRT